MTGRQHSLTSIPITPKVQVDSRSSHSPRGKRVSSRFGRLQRASFIEQAHPPIPGGAHPDTEDKRGGGVVLVDIYTSFTQAENTADDAFVDYTLIGGTLLSSGPPGRLTSHRPFSRFHHRPEYTQSQMAQLVRRCPGHMLRPDFTGHRFPISMR